MLERAQVRFVLLETGAAPRKALRQVISLKLQTLSPFAEFGFCFRESPSANQLCEVWYWDQSELEKKLAAQGGQARAFLPAPAPALIRPPTDGAHVVRWKDGFELQAWQGRQLQRSLFAGTEPHEAQWQTFLRDARLPERPLPARATPVQVDPALISSLGLGGRTELAQLANDSRAWFIAALLAAAGAAVILGGIYQARIKSATELARLELDAIESKNKESFGLDKELALVSKRSESLNALDPGVSQLALMAHLAQADVLSVPQGVTLGEWEYRNKKLRLSFDAADDAFILAEFLRKLERVKVLGNVKLSPESTQRQVVLTADLNLQEQGSLLEPPKAKATPSAAAQQPSPPNPGLGGPSLIPMVRP